jgi:hypothetical protein
MRGLENKFEDLREQQQKILFGEGEEDGGFGSSMGEVEEEDEDMLSESKPSPRN